MTLSLSDPADQVTHQVTTMKAARKSPDVAPFGRRWETTIIGIPLITDQHCRRGG